MRSKIINNLTVLRSFQSLSSIKIDSNGMKAKFYSVILFMLTTGSNVLVVIVSSAIAYFSMNYDESPFKLTGTYNSYHIKSFNKTIIQYFIYLGKINSGIPQFRIPFSDYEDEDEKFSFVEGVSRLWPGVIVVPLVSILSTVSVAKAFSKYV